MEGIAFEVVQDGNIEQCRQLCDELMAFQKSKAVSHPERFDAMSFDTRMKPSHQRALRSHVVVAKDRGAPVGYAFSTVERIEPAARDVLPAWAPKSDGNLGFYPDWLELPQTVGCLSNLYVRDAYRGTGMGTMLFDMAMAWLDAQSDVGTIFVYISNGNDAALRFYLSHGFAFSHDVFGGFIQAACKRKPS